MAEQLCSNPWRNNFVEGKIWLPTPQKSPKNYLNWGVGSSYGTNKPPLPNPSFPYETKFWKSQYTIKFSKNSIHYFYTTYLTRDSTAQCVCSPDAGFNPLEFLSPCGLPVLWCLATSVVLGGDHVVFPRPGSSWFWEAWIRHSYHPPPRDLGVRSVSIVRMWTLVFGWPQLGLISPLRFLSWSRYILGYVERTFFLSWVSKTHPNNWTKRMMNTR